MSSFFDRALEAWVLETCAFLCEMAVVWAHRLLLGSVPLRFSSLQGQLLHLAIAVPYVLSFIGTVADWWWWFSLFATLPLAFAFAHDWMLAWVSGALLLLASGAPLLAWAPHVLGAWSGAQWAGTGDIRAFATSMGILSLAWGRAIPGTWGVFWIGWGLEILAWNASEAVQFTRPVNVSAVSYGRIFLAWAIGIEVHTLSDWKAWAATSPSHLPEVEAFRGAWWSKIGTFPQCGYVFRTMRRVRRGGSASGAPVVMEVPLNIPGERSVEFSFVGAAWCYMLSLHPPVSLHLRPRDNALVLVGVKVGPLAVPLRPRIWYTCASPDSSQGCVAQRRARGTGATLMSRCDLSETSLVFVTSTNARRRVLRLLLLYFAWSFL